MPTWILRKTVDGERVGEPRSCAGLQDIAREPGRLTIQEQIASLLQAGEYTEQLIDGRQEIYDHRGLVGHIVVVTNEPS